MKTISGPTTLQDVFAYYVNNRSDNGYLIDIGCQKPGEGNNSTLLLEKGWIGVGADINDYQSDWNNHKNFKFHQMDVTIKSNIDNLFKDCPNVIDFLSLDVDEGSFECLKNIDLNKYKFKCICIEHDYYRFGENLRVPQREYLSQYNLVIQTAAEDWYVDYNLLESNIVDVLKNIPKHHEITAHEMYNILNWLNISLD